MQHSRSGTRVSDAVRFGDRCRLGPILQGSFYVIHGLSDLQLGAVLEPFARGLTDETPLAAMYASARAARIYDGPDEVHRMVVSRRILKEFEKGGVWRFS